MKAKYLEQLPQWWRETKDYGLILTDDIDSLLSCAIINYIKPNWNIEQVLLFKGNKARCRKGIDSQLKDYLGATKNNTHECIGVDLALQNGKCFDNHLTRMSSVDHLNKEAINPNNVRNLTRNEYSKKYCCSTVLLVWSIYNLPKEGLSDELMMVLLAIDGSYQGYYNNGGKYSYINKDYICNYLDLPEFWECLKRHKEDDFKIIKEKYNLASKITAKNGYLQTDINIDGLNTLLQTVNVHIELPMEKFKLKQEFIDIAVPLNGVVSKLSNIAKNIYCAAITTKSFVNYSVPII